MASFEITWQAPEYEHREKTVSWYWVSIIAAALIIAFSIWQKNFLFGFFIVVAEILVIVWGNRTPRMVSFTFNETGIQAEGGKLHSLNEIESMSVDPLGGGWAEISFIFRAKLRIPFKAIFPENRLMELRSALKDSVKEVPYEPTVIDSIEKLLRF